MTTTTLPLPIVPPDVEAFAAENGVSEYLPKMLDLARRIFPTQPITVQVYEDHEIRDLKKILIEDSLGICARLDADIQKAVDAYVDPWKEAEVPAYPQQFSGPELAQILEVAENNG